MYIFIYIYTYINVCVYMFSLCAAPLVAGGRSPPAGGRYSSAAGADLARTLPVAHPLSVQTVVLSLQLGLALWLPWL